MEMKLNMDETQVITRPGTRIDFSADEITFMREQTAIQNGDRLSYASIAREMNSRYKDHNEGRRTRQSVYEFMTADPSAPVIERVAIPRDLLQQFRATGKGLEQIVINAIQEALSCKTSTQPAQPESAPNAAGSSPSPQTSSPDTVTGSSSNQSRKSGKPDRRH
jgi:uncharacterized protein (DUF4415 family)